MFAHLNTMSEKFFLKWNDFKGNVLTFIRSIKDNSDFSDVTLACEDGIQMDAHKMILACSSPVFQNILKTNKHAHPLIYLRGIKSKDLLCILDFLYYGEANVDQENLESFVAIAEELELKGFKGEADCEEDKQKERLEFPAAKKELHKENTRLAQPDALSAGSDSRLQTTPQDSQVRTVSGEHPLYMQKELSKFPALKNEPHKENTQPALSVGSDSRLESAPPDYQVQRLSGEHSLYMQKLDEQVNSMMIKSFKKSIHGTPQYICNACGKEGQQSQVSDHIEVEHLEGVSIPCNFCGKFFRSRHSKAVHITRGCKGPKRRL